MTKRDDPDERVSNYWDDRYKEIDRSYAERDVERENERTRQTHRSVPTIGRSSTGAGGSTQYGASAVDLRAMRELKNKLLADISTCKYLLPSLRERWHYRLSDVVLTAVDAEAALTGLSEDVLKYRGEYPFHLIGLGRAGQAEILRSDLAGFGALLGELANQCMMYRIEIDRTVERVEAAIARRRQSQSGTHDVAGSPSSASVTVCRRCKRSADLAQENGRTWCSWCGDWASP